MRRKPFSFSPGAGMLLGFLIFSLSWQELTALLAAAAVHELGHLLAMKLMYVPVYGLSLTLSGPVIRCGAAQTSMAEGITALCGPLAGMALFLLVRPIWPLCAEMSLALSAMNLLPVLPLDGGRALRAWTHSDRLLRSLGILISFAVIVSGLFAVAQGWGLGMTAFGVWLLLLACQGHENDVK